jgi:hypothetical protein
MKQKKKPAPMRILQPGERNEFWEMILRIRDTGDPRWLGTFSYGFRLTAEAYEKVRDADVTVKKAA